MGYNHAASGVLAGVATAPIVGANSPLQMAVWSAVCGAMALWPDWDSHTSTATTSAGFVTQGCARLVGFLAFGHRQGTHDLVLSPLVVAAVLWCAQLWPISLVILLGLILNLVLRGVLRTRRRSIGLAAGLAICTGLAYYAVRYQVPELVLLPVAAVVGTLIHIAGDALTDEGVPVPLAWLWGDDRRISLGLFRTGAPIERLLVMAQVAGIVWLSGLFDWTVEVSRAANL